MNTNRKSQIIILSVICCLSCILSACSNNAKEVVTHRSKEPIKINAKYMGWACGSNTPQVMPIEVGNDLLNEKIEYGFTFYTDGSIETPDHLTLSAVPGNKFELTGYYYYTIENNQKQLHQRFDLVSWDPITPFKIWDESGNEISTKELNNNQNFQFNSNKPLNEINFTMAHKYDPC